MATMSTVEFRLTFEVENEDEYLQLASQLSALGPYVMDVEDVPDEWRPS